jgi:O-antigen ligase
MFILAYLLTKDDRSIQRFIGIYVIITLTLILAAALAFLSNDFSIMQALRMNLVIPQRLSFWANNPNQLSFAILPLPLLIVGLHKSDHFSWRQASLLFLTLAICFFIGLIMHSDALFLAWVAAIAAMAVMHYSRRSNLASWKLLIVVCALLFAFGSFKAYTSHAIAQAYSDSPFGVGMGENKLSIRGQLWDRAFDVWMQSPVIGHGPGAFSWMGEPSKFAEAHNTMIDIVTQSGLVGVAMCILVCWTLTLRAWRTRNSTALALLAGVLMFSMAHFVMRQPIFWFYLVLCYMITRSSIITPTNIAQPE